MIGLELGTPNVRMLILNWKGDCKNALNSENYANSMFRSMYNLNSDLEIENLQKENSKIWNSIKILNQTTLITRDALIDIQLEHNEPILMKEFYPIRLKITNKEEFLINNLTYIYL